MIFTIILPKWDIVTDNVIYPSFDPSKAIRSIALRFLLSNLFLTLVLIKFMHTKSTLTRRCRNTLHMS